MRLAATLIMSMAASGAGAADFGPPRTISDGFNAMASLRGNRGARMVLRQCAGKSDSRCMYSMPGKISVLVVADESKPSSAQLVTFVSNQQSNPRAFIDACLLAMQTWSPKREMAEIAAAFKVLFSPPLKDNLPRSVQLGDIKYTLNDFTPGALAFIAADAALP